MNKLAYFGDGKRIGFNRESELGPGYKSPFTVGGIEYNSVDQYMETYEYILDDLDYWKRDMNQQNYYKILNIIPIFRKEVGHKNWDDIKEEMMMTALREKFRDPRLRDILLNTKDKELQFCDDNLFWGRKMAHKDGGNMLGKYLMLLRSKLIFFNNYLLWIT